MSSMTIVNILIVLLIGYIIFRISVGGMSVSEVIARLLAKKDKDRKDDV